MKPNCNGSLVDSWLIETDVIKLEREKKMSNYRILIVFLLIPVSVAAFLMFVDPYTSSWTPWAWGKGAEGIAFMLVLLAWLIYYDRSYRDGKSD